MNTPLTDDYTVSDEQNSTFLESESLYHHPPLLCQRKLNDKEMKPHYGNEI